MKILITVLIVGGLIACMADAEAWAPFLISKAVGISAMSAGLMLALREKED